MIQASPKTSHRSLLSGVRDPLPGESLNGYVAYRAAAAMMPDTLVFGRGGDASDVMLARFGVDVDSGIHDLAQILDVDEAVLDGIAHHRVGEGRPGRRRIAHAVVDARLLHRRSRMFAPKSLSNSPHHRAAWQVRTLPFCDETWEMLIDRCPRTWCLARQGWRHAKGIDRCDQCGSSLAEAVVPRVPEALRGPLRAITGLVHYDAARVLESVSALPPPLCHAPPGDLMELACAVAGFVDPQIRAFTTRFLRLDAEPSDVCRAMASAWSIMQGWPSAAADVAGERLGARMGRLGDGNAGATLDLLELADPGGAPAALRAAVGLLRETLTGNAGEGLRLREVAGHTGLRSSDLIRHRKNGDLRTIFHLDGTRVVPMIARESVERLQSAWGEGVAIKLVAASLGTTTNGVEQMLRDGLIAEAGNDAAFARTDRVRVDRRSLEAFLAAMKQTAKPASGEAFTFTMTHMAGGMGGGLKPWSAWFRALVDARVPFTIDEGDEPLVQRLGLNAEGVDELRRLPCEDPSGIPFRSRMSRGDAVVTLNLHARHMRKAFAAWPSNEALPVTEIVELARRYVAPSELAVLLSHPVMAVAALMRRVKVPRSPWGYDRTAAIAAGSRLLRLRRKGRDAWRGAAVKGA